MEMRVGPPGWVGQERAGEGWGWRRTGEEGDGYSAMEMQVGLTDRGGASAGQGGVGRR